MKFPDIDKVDATLLVGLIILGSGLWIVSPSLALSSIGALIVIAGLMGASKG